MKISNYSIYFILLFIIVLFIIYYKYNVEKLTSSPVGAKNNNVNVTFTPTSTLSDAYSVCLYKVMDVDFSKRKNVMKYGGCPSLGTTYTGMSGKYGWMIGLVKPPYVDTYDIKLTFDKNVGISDGEIAGLITLNNMNYRTFVSINKNVVNIRIKTNQPQIMVSLKYL